MMAAPEPTPQCVVTTFGSLPVSSKGPSPMVPTPWVRSCSPPGAGADRVHKAYPACGGVNVPDYFPPPAGGARDLRLDGLGNIRDRARGRFVPWRASDVESPQDSRQQAQLMRISRNYRRNLDLLHGVAVEGLRARREISDALLFHSRAEKPLLTSDAPESG